MLTCILNKQRSRWSHHRKLNTNLQVVNNNNNNKYLFITSDINFIILIKKQKTNNKVRAHEILVIYFNII